MPPKRASGSKRKAAEAATADSKKKTPDPNEAQISKKSIDAPANAFAGLPDTLTDSGWIRLLQPLFETDSWRGLVSKLFDRQVQGETIYPPVSSVMRAFNLTPLNQVRVVILGQDPYHGPGQADGLAFSFSGDSDKLPPSLKNIFKELVSDIPGFTSPKFGSLEKWAKQGVLLLNTALTVASGKPGSHTKLGWTDFTDGVLKLLCANAQHPIVFLLWGKPAQAKAQVLQGHVILTAAHPSPAACGAFNSCRHFSKANSALAAGPPIDWRLD